MEEFLKESAHPESKDFYLKLLARKEKFLGLIKEGKVTGEGYQQMLEKKKSQNIAKLDNSLTKRKNSKGSR